MSERSITLPSIGELKKHFDSKPHLADFIQGIYGKDLFDHLEVRTKGILLTTLVVDVEVACSSYFNKKTGRFLPVDRQKIIRIILEGCCTSEELESTIGYYCKVFHR